MSLRWHLRRLRRMGPGEVVWRARNVVLQVCWWPFQGDRWPTAPATPCWQGGGIPRPATKWDPAAAAALVRAADAILAGVWPIFETFAPLATDGPDWFRDPVAPGAAPRDRYCFWLRFRDRIANIKHIWELSRLHHVTVLAAAWRVGGEARHARRALADLAAWWRANPPLRGVHWVSGIELGLRLIAWSAARRLLDGFPGVADAFEHNPVFQRQLHAHQRWIATFHSRFSSANNHLIAEMAGLLVGASAFPLFAESAGWARTAAAALTREIARQNFPDGLNRELSGDYQLFVLELCLVAGAEADAAGTPLGEGYWLRLRAMADALAATVDARLGTARQNDGDGGRALVLDTPGRDPVAINLEACAAIFGAAPWWPAVPGGSIGAQLLADLAKPRRAPSAWPPRPVSRPNGFASSGVSILRDLRPGPDEIWCRFDHAPHGFLATAAHAHADALSFELRFGGQPILVDPGTYRYHGMPSWRNYFRSTIAHNALELNARDQAISGGTFLWLTRPAARLLAAANLDDGACAVVEASHDGYHEALHCRRLLLDRHRRMLEVRDRIEAAGPVAARLAFNLHPDIGCRLQGAAASLIWTNGVRAGHATLMLPPVLVWSMHRGETDPIRGWYSPRFGVRRPAVMLLGTGRIMPGQCLVTRLAFGGAVPLRQVA